MADDFKNIFVTDYVLEEIERWVTGRGWHFEGPMYFGDDDESGTWFIFPGRNPERLKEMLDREWGRS